MSFPVSAFSSIEFELVHDTRAPDKRLFRYTSAGTQDPYFMFALTTSPQKYADAMALAAELDAYQGPLEKFTISNPFLPIAEISNISLASSAAKDKTVIRVNANAEPKPGDFLQIAGSQKAYSIRRAVGAGAGKYDLTLTQGLIRSHSTGDSIDYGADVNFQVCLDNRDATKIDGSKGIHEIIHDVELIEQL